MSNAIARKTRTDSFSQAVQEYQTFVDAQKSQSLVSHLLGVILPIVGVVLGLLALKFLK